MNITSKHVRAMYETLRQLPPFDQWGLPPAEAINFRIMPVTEYQGYYDDGCIKVSKNRVATLDRLAVVTAHEMVHLTQDLHDFPVNHGAEFKHLAQQVCASFGFDPKEF